MTPAGGLLPGTERRDVAVAGVRFRLYRADPDPDPDPGPADAGAGAAHAVGSPAPPPALLLHGVPQTAAAWRHLLPALAADRTVLAPDLKGLGGSEVGGPYDVDTLIRELAALVLHEVDGAVDVVGHDWGGSLALGLARSRPELVRRVVVISAPYRRLAYRRAPHMPFFALPVAPEVAFALGGRALVRRLLAYCWRADTLLDPDVREHYATAYDDPARVAAMLGYYRAAARARVRPGRRSRRPARPAARPPALVLWGAADPVLPLSFGEAVVQDWGPQAQFLTLPGVGHLVPEEAPEETALAVTEFLAGPEPDPPATST